MTWIRANTGPIEAVNIGKPKWDVRFKAGKRGGARPCDKPHPYALPCSCAFGELGVCEYGPKRYGTILRKKAAGLPVPAIKSFTMLAEGRRALFPVFRRFHQNRQTMNRNYGAATKC
jgi:hypothetical protein